MQKEDKENEGHPSIRCPLMKNSLQENDHLNYGGQKDPTGKSHNTDNTI